MFERQRNKRKKIEDIGAKEISGSTEERVCDMEPG